MFLIALHVIIVDKNLLLNDPMNLFIESLFFYMQLYRLYLLINICKGFLMINKFKVLQVFI